VVSIPVLDDMATWLQVDATLLGYTIGIIFVVLVAIFVSVIADSPMATMFSVFAVWVFIALPGIELWPTWTISIAFLLLLLAFVFPSGKANPDARGR